VRRLLPLALAVAVLTGCSTSESASSRPQTSPKPSATPDASERALAQPPPPVSAPDPVEETRLDGSPWSIADGQEAYLVAVRVLPMLRQDPALLRSGKRTHADFETILTLSTPKFRAYLDKRIAAWLQAQEDPSDTAAAELADELQSAMTIGERPADEAASASPSPRAGWSGVRFRDYDPDAGAYGVLKVGHTAAYAFKRESGGTGLAVAFDVLAPYNVISDEGTRQIVTVHVIDFRMIMQEVEGIWLWDGFDMEDVRVEVRDRTA
jgi:hypothetical protein